MADKNPRAVHELVMRLGAAKGWTSHAAIHRETGVAASTLARWKKGGGGRTDWFDGFEEAYPLPRGTLLDVYEGRRTPDEVVAHMRHDEYEWDGVDLRSGADLAADERTAIRNYVQSDVLDQAMAMGAMLGRTVERLGLKELPVDDVRPPADLLVVGSDGRTTSIEAKAGKFQGDQQVQQIVGLHTMWENQGVQRMILFTAVDWPREAVEELAKYGIEYVSSPTHLEVLLSKRVVA